MRNICFFTVPASRDIESIIDFIADRSGLDAADRFLNKINGKCNNLASLRSFPVDDYLIFYRPIETGIEVLRVVSSYRDLDALFD